MIRQEVVKLSSQWRDGSPMYPGLWLRMWARIAGTGVWVLVGCVPYEEQSS